MNLIEVNDADNPEDIRLFLQQLGAECDLAYQDYKAMNVMINEKASEGTNVRELLQQERDRIAQELAKGE